MRIGWIRTYTGNYVCLAKPDPSTISIVDIAHHLACEARWAGATSRHYSVAEHSIWVARFVRELVPAESRDIATAHALLHDAHEAYIKDIPTPLKAMLGDGYRKMADGLDAAIRVAVGLVAPPEVGVIGAIKAADSYASWCEAKALLASCTQIKKAGDEPPEGLLRKVPMVSELRAPRSISIIESSFLSYLNYTLKQSR